MQIKNETADEEGKGFFLDPQIYTDTTADAVHFVYYSLSDPLDQKILELYFGLFGKTKMGIMDIATTLNIPYAKTNKRLKELADMVAETSESLK